MFLGVLRPFSGAPALGWLPEALVLVAALALLAAGIAVRSRGLVDLVRLHTAHRAPIDLVLAGFVLFAVLYGFSAFTVYTREPRYLFVLYPLLALGLSWGVLRMPRRAAGAVGVALVAAILGTSIVTMRTADARGETTGHVDRLPIRPKTCPRWLRRSRPTGSTRSTRTTGSPTRSRSRRTARSTSSARRGHRFPAMAAAVARDPDPAFAAAIGRPADRLQAAIAASGARATRIDVRSIAVFVQVTPPGARALPKALD